MSLQLDTQHELKNNIGDILKKIMDDIPTNFNEHLTSVLKLSLLDTPLGTMLGIADENHLYLLEFIDCRDLKSEIKRLCIKTRSTITPGTTPPLISITNEIKSYFDGNLKEFNTPIYLLGTPFQKLVWKELMRIPYGITRSYTEQAISLGNRIAYRAVANANGANQIAIVVPCHRIIRGNGDLGGYSGGIMYKKWLIEFENTINALSKRS